MNPNVTRELLRFACLFGLSGLIFLLFLMATESRDPNETLVFLIAIVIGVPVLTAVLGRMTERPLTVYLPGRHQGEVAAALARTLPKSTNRETIQRHDDGSVDIDSHHYRMHIRLAEDSDGVRVDEHLSLIRRRNGITTGAFSIWFLKQKISSLA